jgi:diguanylate cyclase (GGDEF)-like protein/PAS domain S-box-containing protein
MLRLRMRATAPTAPPRNARMSSNDRAAHAVIQNILLIQGDPGDAKLVQDALAGATYQQFHVEWIKSGALGFERAASLCALDRSLPTALSAILVDLLLPDTAGLAIIDALYVTARNIPVIALCSQRDEDLGKAAIGRGAQDFLLKEQITSYLLPKTVAAVIERAAITEALFAEKERAQVTLNSIGDAVISTDVEGRITYMNQVAERLTGWPLVEATSRPLEEIFRIIDVDTRVAIPNPMTKAARENATVGLPPTCVLIRRDGVESAIEDSAAPIHDRYGRITGSVMVFHDVSAARALTQRLAYVAQHDSLTDLPNRALLNDRLTQSLALAQRHHTALALLYLDLDRFKHINDSMGHLIGDQMLQTVALRLTQCVRASDTVSRFGGDEFVILLSELAHEQDAAVSADKILRALRLPYVLGEHELHVTASIGIAIHPGDGVVAETLLQNADLAMYESKHLGRNNYQYYRSDLNSSATQRQTLESGLRHAIELKSMQLRYQPIVNLKTGLVAGVEALLRWQHPSLGLLLPDQFIGVAEESGLIVPIGNWVLREACRQAVAWHAAGLPKIRLAVNISAVELRTKEFLPSVKRCLADTGFDPKCLELELTETYLMQDSSATYRLLAAIKELGVQLALDDFGTGYSSLSYMRRFPINTLKVDRSFVRDLTMDSGDASVVSAIINMGSSMHMRVVAEGVESADQVAFLQDHSCPEAQGYHFSRPLPPKDFYDWTSRNATEHASA